MMKRAMSFWLLAFGGAIFTLGAANSLSPRSQRRPGDERAGVRGIQGATDSGAQRSGAQSSVRMQLAAADISDRPHGRLPAVAGRGTRSQADPEQQGDRWPLVTLSPLHLVTLSPVHSSLTSSLHHFITSSLPEDWSPRLESLTPDNPLAYFELGEEVMDAAAGDDDRNLARQLFRLAGALDPATFGRSAALALADLADDPQEKRRLLALAALLDRPGGGEGEPNWGPPPEMARTIDLGGASSLSDSFSYYRRGLGNRAMEELDKDPAAAELLARYGDAIGGEARYRENARRYRTGESPIKTWDELITMLRLEAALLAGEDRSWSAELLLTGGQPIVEIDPGDISGALGVNPARALWRNGRWVAE